MRDPPLDVLSLSSPSHTTIVAARVCPAVETAPCLLVVCYRELSNGVNVSLLHERRYARVCLPVLSVTKVANRRGRALEGKQLVRPVSPWFVLCLGCNRGDFELHGLATLSHSLTVGLCGRLHCQNPPVTLCEWAQSIMIH